MSKYRNQSSALMAEECEYLEANLRTNGFERVAVLVSGMSVHIDLPRYSNPSQFRRLDFVCSEFGLAILNMHDCIQISKWVRSVYYFSNGLDESDPTTLTFGLSST
jgi:hypothetical protein